MKNLKELREKHNLTQRKIATFLNVAYSTYNGYEKETSEPTIETLKKLADYYNVSIDYLVDRPFRSEIGYLTEEQKELTKAMQKLNEQNFWKAHGYINGLLSQQNN